MQKNKKLIYVLTFSFFWSLLITFGKFILNLGINPLIYTMYYQAIAFVILFFYTFVVRKQKPDFSDRKTTRNILLLGFFLSLGLVTSVFGLDISTSINYGFIIKSGVVFGPLLAFFFLDEKLSRRKIILIPIFLFGVYLVTTNGERIIPQKGDVLILSAAFLFSITDVLMKKLTNNTDPVIVATSRAFLATLFLFIFAIIFVKDLSPNVSPIYLFVAGCIASIAQLLLLKTISLSSVSYLSMMTMVAPIIITLIGFFFIKEPFTIVHAIGGFIIIVSGILVEKYEI